MDFLFFILFFFLLLVPLVLGMIIPMYKNHNRATGDIVNYDSTMKKFVYKVNLSNRQIINTLNTKNELDELFCTFDFEKSVIRFSEYGSHRDYYFQVIEYDDFSVLRLEQVALFGMQSSVPLKLNSFMVNKLQAEIIPFSQYNF